MKKVIIFVLALTLLLGNFSYVKAEDLGQKLKGRILLQVESRGEAWYVNPEDGTRMYMKDGNTAYSMMRNLGLGITNANLEKIPIGLEERFEELDSDNDGLSDKLEEALGSDKYDTDTDNDGYLDGDEVKNGYDVLSSNITKLSYDNNLVNNLKGKILLQVESRGEAWYVHPVDGKRYYMTDGPAAYQIMRYLSLGITNSDLRTISYNREYTNWSTYSDENYNFIINYPEDWEFSEIELHYQDNSSPYMIGLRPTTVVHDFQWGVNVYDKNYVDIQEVAGMGGTRFEDRIVKENELMVGGLPALRYIVTTESIPDWYSEQIVIEDEDYIYTIGNGAVEDDLFTDFYNSFRIQK